MPLKNPDAFSKTPGEFRVRATDAKYVTTNLHAPPTSGWRAPRSYWRNQRLGRLWPARRHARYTRDKMGPAGRAPSHVAIWRHKSVRPAKFEPYHV